MTPAELATALRARAGGCEKAAPRYGPDDCKTCGYENWICRSCGCAEAGVKSALIITSPDAVAVNVAVLRWAATWVDGASHEERCPALHHQPCDCGIDALFASLERALTGATDAKP